MLYAAVVQSPVFKGKLKAVDESKLAGMKGIRKVVKLDDAVAVVADNWWRAKTAADALDIELGRRRQRRGHEREHPRFPARRACAPATPASAASDGDVTRGLAQAAKRIEAEYEVPFLGHATLEPQNCTRSRHRRRPASEIWAPTQNGEATLAAAAQAAGVPPRNVVVHKMHARRRLRPARRARRTSSRWRCRSPSTWTSR